jgi:flagellar hook protein FlgE
LDVELLITIQHPAVSIQHLFPGLDLLEEALKCRPTDALQTHSKKEKTGGNTMSLTSAMFTGVSGLLNQAEGINVIGNNIANVNTIGYKGSRTLFSDVLSTSIGAYSQIGHGVQIQKIDNLFTQSSLETTSVPTDVAIQGDTFFAVAKPGTVANAAVAVADAYYTRAGAFRVDSGLALINPDGYNVLDSTGVPIVFAATDGVAAPNTKDFQKVVSIDPTGAIRLLYSDAAGNTSTLYYQGNGANPSATAPGVQLGVAKIPNPSGMTKEGGTLYKQTGTITGGSGTPVFQAANGTNEKILNNNLEASNVDMANEFVKMILTQRAYSANSKTITTSDEMTQEVLNMKR